MTRWSIIVTSLVAILLISSSALGLPVIHESSPVQVGSPPPLAPRIRAGTSSSTNWSGYAVTGTDGSVSSVEGSWTNPSVSCPASGNSYAAFWVGIDGYSSDTVEQTGTLAECSSGSATYYAWYEFYPAGSVEITSVPVSPGQTISASVSYSTSTAKFTATITDTTTGSTFSKSSAVSGADRSSAEWIAEAPSSGSTVLPLADFGTAYYGTDYTDVSSTNYATISGTSGQIGSFGSSVQEITMVNGQSEATEAQPSPLSADGTSFLVNFGVVAGAITPSSPSIDSGQSVTLTSHPTGGTTPYTYQWYAGASCTAPISGATSATYVASPATTATYYYEVTDSGSTPNSSCSAGDTVTVASPPSAGAITPSSPKIDSGQSILLTSHAGGGAGALTTNWYAEAACGGSVVATASTYDPSPGSTTTYSYTVTDSSTGNSGPETSSCSTGDTVTVEPFPTISSPITSSVTIDPGQTYDYSVTATGGVGPYGYAWNLPSGVTASSGCASSNPTCTVTSTTSNTYAVSVTVSDTGSMGSGGTWPSSPSTLVVLQHIPSIELTTLLNVYNNRPDLQAAFPQAATGNYANLVNWAYDVSTRQGPDSNYSTLAPYAYWYTLMYTYNQRPDLQSAFPNAYYTMSSYTSLINWAGGIVTNQWVDGSYSTLAPFGYWYALMYTYNQRSDLQTAFPNVYASQTSYQSLINWAGGVTTQQWADGSYNTLAPFGYYYALMMEYNIRPDVQSAFPDAYSSWSSYTSLINWAAGIVTNQWADGSYSTLAPYGYYYTLMMEYNMRPDVQSAFPKAYTSQSQYQSLINWAGGIVTDQWADGSYSTLNTYGYYYDLMMEYNMRPDVQSAFPNAYTSQTQYQNLINWADQVVTQVYNDGAYNNLSYYASYYEKLAT